MHNQDTPGPIPFWDRFIGPGKPVVVIAEVGVNHEGDPDVCAQMIEAAARAGADAIKLQTMDADENYVPGTPSHELFSRCWLDQEQTAAMFALARSLGMEAFTTCGDPRTLAWVEKLAPAAYKISSGLLTHLPLIRMASATGRPLLMSSGMGGLDMVADAVGAACDAGCAGLGLFQCTSLYPAPHETLNLAAMEVMARRFNVPVGFSDHSLGHEAAVVAVGAGACMVEKHFSLDPSRPSFDHRLSVDEAGMRELVAAVRKAEAMLGERAKVVSTEQQVTADNNLRSIVARADVAPGDVLSLENVGFMRTLPELRGLAPGRWGELEGRRARRALRRYETFRPGDYGE